MRKEALLIIDVQNDYFKNGRCELYQPEKALMAIKKLLHYFRTKKSSVNYIQHIVPENADFFAPNTEGVEISGEIKPLVTEKVITKHYPNSFQKTELQVLLKKDGITDLVICGMMTHMC